MRKNGGLVVCMRLPAGSVLNVNPVLVLGEWLEQQHAQASRIGEKYPAHRSTPETAKNFPEMLAFGIAMAWYYI